MVSPPFATVGIRPMGRCSPPHLRPKGRALGLELHSAVCGQHTRNDGSFRAPMPHQPNPRGTTGPPRAEPVCFDLDSAVLPPQPLATSPTTPSPLISISYYLQGASRSWRGTVTNHHHHHRAIAITVSPFSFLFLLGGRSQTREPSTRPDRNRGPAAIRGALFCEGARSCGFVVYRVWSH